MRPASVPGLQVQMRLEGGKDAFVVFEELSGDGFDIKCLIVPLLDGQGRQTEQVAGLGLQVQHGHPL